MTSADASAARFGSWAALGTAATTALTFGVAVATPPLSGPFCKAGCFQYPYLDVAERFPRDYAWMLPALASLAFYVALLVALDARAAAERRVFTRLGVAFGVIAATTLLGDYYVQLAVIQPSLESGEADGISLLTQYNPHGLFIALEELGYSVMSLSLLCTVPSLGRGARLERGVRYVFLGGFALSVAAVAWFVLRLGHARAYLLEVALLSINWTVLIVSGLMLTLVFRRARASARPGELED